jgi:nucleotide-binding universal stress UspA family protein
METKINNILLVPTDFSDVGNNAIDLASKAAKHLGYKMCLLHITEKKDDDTAKEKLNILAKEVKNNFGVEVETLTKKGSIFSTIGKIAKDIGAKLIYMGTHGKVGMQKLTGSFALKVITSSEVPVIVVQKRAFESFNDIVLPITSDFGPWEKTKWATYIAKEFNAKIHIYQLAGDTINSAVKLIANHFKENDIKHDVQIAKKSANFEKQIIDYATSINSELIMIMTNPGKSITNFILGSYDEDIIFNSSQIPVMCINPREVNWKKITSR